MNNPKPAPKEVHVIPEGIGPTRLSDYARGCFESLPSRKGVQKAIKRGEILIDKEPGQTASWVQAGHVLTLLVPSVKSYKPFPLQLEVMLEDESLAVINKPAGFEVSGNRYKTIQNALSSNLTPSTRPDALPQARPLHRLDFSTSGLLLIAKTARAQMHLSHQFETRSIKKSYVAIVTGTPPSSGTINTPIQGQTSLSHFECLRTIPSLKSGSLSLIKLYPETGRTHQLRIHMSQLGFPIVGDHKYGPQGSVLRGKGLFLSALELTFNHPDDHKRINVKIPRPHKFNSLLAREERRWKKYNEGS